MAHSPLARALPALLCLLSLVSANAQGAGGVPAPPPRPLAELVQEYRDYLAAGDTKRLSTLSTIGRLRTPEAARFLVERIDDAETIEQYSLISALGQTGQPGAFSGLREIAGGNWSVSHRSRAITELARFPAKDATPVLLEFTGSNEAILAAAATTGLTTLMRQATTSEDETGRIAAALLTLTRKAKAPQVRATAVTAVDSRVFDGEGAVLEPEKWVKQLRKQLKSEKDDAPLAAMLRALARRADPKDWKLVAAHCKHDSATVRLAALQSLDIFEKDAKELLKYFVSALDDTDARLREAGYEGLRGSKNAAVLEKATRAVMEDPVPAVRQAAGELLASSKTERATDLLLRALVLALREEETATPTPGVRGPRLTDSLAKSLAASLDDEQAPRVAAKVTEAADVHVRLAALRGLMHSSRPEAEGALRAALRDRDPRVALTAIDAVRETRLLAGLPDLVSVARASRNRDIILRCIEALGLLGEGDAAAGAYLMDTLHHPVVEVVMAGIDAVGVARVVAAVPPLSDLLTHNAWQVRSATVAALKKIRVKECIPPLLARLPEEGGKVFSEIILALTHITGKELGTDPELWQAWWDTAGADFQVPSLDELANAGNRTGTGGTYYGIPVTSRRVTFVLDISCSMGAAAQGSDGEVGTRLTVAQAEMVKVISNLERGTLFNLVFFDDQIDAWKRNLTPATAKYRTEAISRVRKQAPRGGTNIFDSLELAFQDPRVDTIYLLTDGAPGSGKFVSPADIRREIARMNRVRRITIHCIAIGAANDLLKNLAEDSGGVYVSH